MKYYIIALLLMAGAINDVNASQEGSSKKRCIDPEEIQNEKRTIDLLCANFYSDAKIRKIGALSLVTSERLKNLGDDISNKLQLLEPRLDLKSSDDKQWADHIQKVIIKIDGELELRKQHTARK